MKNIRILCYGDSNTWGYVSGSSILRYGNDERWTKILSSLLGEEYEVIEEGLNSRTIISDDTRIGKEGRNGYSYLIPCLDSHDPIDLVILFLGTNELKNVYNNTAREIGDMFENYLVKTVINRKSVIDKSSPKLLIIPPAVIDESTDYCRANDKYLGGTEKSKELNDIYEEIAKKYNCSFLSSLGLETGVDGVHLTKESHRKLAELLKERIDYIFNSSK